MALGVERLRQREHMLKILAHHGQPPAMGEMIGPEGDPDARGDVEQCRERPASHVPANIRRRSGACQRINDPAEQDRHRESCSSHGNIGERDECGQPPLRP